MCGTRASPWGIWRDIGHLIHFCHARGCWRERLLVDGRLLHQLAQSGQLMAPGFLASSVRFRFLGESIDR